MNEHTHHFDADTPDEAQASDAETRDPVCGMAVKAGSPHVFAHDGEQYAFCSARCREKFRTVPAKFTGRAKVEPSASARLVAPGAGVPCPGQPISSLIFMHARVWLALAMPVCISYAWPRSARAVASVTNA